MLRLTHAARQRPCLGLGLAALLALVTLSLHQADGLRMAPVAPKSHDGILLARESNLEEQAVNAGLIIVGQVRDVRSRAVPGNILTDVTLETERTLKGQNRQSLTLTLPGGQVGEKQLYVGGVPNFVSDERVLLFLTSNASF